MNTHVNDMTVQQLNWCVAKIMKFKHIHVFNFQIMVSNKKNSSYDFDPAGGSSWVALAEAHKINVVWYDECWRATCHNPLTTLINQWEGSGNTMAVAVVRSLIISQIGNMVDLPDSDWWPPEKPHHKC